jgi:predicted MFS family arabinose efflux permease
MTGALVGNLLWKKLAPKYKKIFISSYILVILAFLNVALFKSEISYFIFFFLMGMAIDGFRISGMNILFEIAPEDKRPIYVALQNTLTSIGLFFSIPGGFLLEKFGYGFLYLFTITMLLIGLWFARKIEVEEN